MQSFLDDHFSHIIMNQADKSWEPEFHAHPNVASTYKSVAGIPVAPDLSLANGVIEMRSAETGAVMARYEGVRL
jgi:hypothetical protein